MGKPWTLPAAYEEAYAAAMRALAKKEGRVGLLPRSEVEQEAHKCATKWASEDTARAIQMIAERPMTSAQLCELLGITQHSVTNRLASLQRAGVVSVVGRKKQGKWQQYHNIWGPGPEAQTWLARVAKRRAV
jgi:predicted HTH transcriptional regulator